MTNILESGASEGELTKLEHQLGVALPEEYRQFLSRWRFLDIDAGFSIWGPNSEGSDGGLWVSEEHKPGCRYLVFGDYWFYADGDQLMFDLNDSEQCVVAYLHEYEGLVEYFAPTFSLALWRVIHERDNGEEK